ncbi:FadR family transcriptional regulator [Mobiluncus mulieris]|uniref:FadR family transcriptional regulator n=1 Tax=Mobiluncus mulieris TaxID=2052 RepID=A0A7Y0U2J9_9ACTO|nr:FCD domain-containing protein [Mobiluncus mulieris]NMW65730.1 FadR family transcriptional regulator [Mobiluncus mulieris]
MNPTNQNNTGVSGRTLKQQLVDELGFSIVSRELAPGTLLQLEPISNQKQVSMSVVREAVSILTSLGLVESKKKLGTVVLPTESWNHSSAEIITWRLRDPKQRLAQFRWLVELRYALEPMAARLAAENRGEESGQRLMKLTEELIDYGEKGEMDAFLRTDIEFHEIILRETGNPLIASMSQHLDVVLSARHSYGLMPSHPDIAAMHFHRMLAHGIQEQSPERAYRAAVLIVDQATEEFLKTNGET